MCLRNAILVYFFNNSVKMYQLQLVIVGGNMSRRVRNCLSYYYYYYYAYYLVK